MRSAIRKFVILSACIGIAFACLIWARSVKYYDELFLAPSSRSGSRGLIVDSVMGNLRVSECFETSAARFNLTSEPLFWRPMGELMFHDPDNEGYPASLSGKQDFLGFEVFHGRFSGVLIPGENNNFYGVTVPDWAILFSFAVVLFLTFVKFRLRPAEHRNDLCRNCGYDLRASKDRCPECGTPIAQTQITEMVANNQNAHEDSTVSFSTVASPTTAPS